MTPVNKKTLMGLIAMVSMMPMSSYAWHGDGHRGWDGEFGPRGEGNWFDHCDARAPHAMRGHRVQRHTFGPVVRTFGMDEKQAKSYADDVKKLVNITKKQEAAWNVFSQSFIALAAARYEHHESHKDFRHMSRQEFLEHRSHWMTKQAKAFDGFVKVRAQLQNVLTPEQMERFDFIVATGHLVEPSGYHSLKEDLQKTRVPEKP